jgi:hypothetical protein
MFNFFGQYFFWFALFGLGFFGCFEVNLVKHKEKEGDGEVFKHRVVFLPNFVSGDRGAVPRVFLNKVRFGFWIA